MGCVYEVVADDDETHLALKAFTLDHGNREFLKKRFLAEAKILSRLNHPRLVHVHKLSIDEPNGTPYYVMDLVRSATGEAETLEDVRRAGKVTEAKVLQWFADIREGLEYIHAQGVVHRDVKLENVLIDKVGHAVLSDFGVSRIFDDRLRNELMVTTTFIAGETTGTQPVMGTYWYLAPEIRKGGAATPDSDWYSLGVLMYRLLTGMWYEPNTKAFDLLAPFSKKCQQIVRQLLSDDARARRPRPEDDCVHGAG
ncbi:MAG: serine/threonine protein kinase, partial [bacterium]|nr:serine/threonine protein kinase [Candidatus Colisoma equi]